MGLRLRMWIGMVVAVQIVAQDSSSLTGMQLRQGADVSGQSSSPMAMADAVPKESPVSDTASQEEQAKALDVQKDENQKRDDEIRQMKAKENGPKRFASDLFDTRQYGTNATDGGISGDYVLGVGDRLHLSAFGSATFELLLQVDGRGGVVVPKIGTISVAGMDLTHARAAIQSKVDQVFSHTTVDVSVTRLREVRVFVLGDVYKPGSYLVPSLSSLINVLGLAGGPTSVGSYRDIKVIRDGQAIRTMDLYPLRADGLGDINISFRSGDTIFVPLAKNQVQLEGGFSRVIATVPNDLNLSAPVRETDEQLQVEREIRQIQIQLGRTPQKFTGNAELALREEKERKLAEANAAANQPSPQVAAATMPSAGSSYGLAGGVPYSPMNMLGAGTATSQSMAAGLPAVSPQPVVASGQPGGTSAGTTSGTGAEGATSPVEKAKLEERLDILQQRLVEIKSNNLRDQRISQQGMAPENELAGQPAWLRQWKLEGKAPVMQFEMLPNETLKNVLDYAGGFALQAFSGSVTVRRLTASGAFNVVNVPASAMASFTLQRGDVVTALPVQDFNEDSVTVSGWARIQGQFARKDGQRVGEFLRSLSLVLPDTYMERGELVRTLPDGSKRYFAFNVAKALDGDAEHDLELQGRDAIELYRIGDLRLPKTLTVVGPVSMPGKFEFIEGMRASDLLFRAGVPLKSADRLVAELAHVQDGATTQVVRLDLAMLLSDTRNSPVDLKDDTINPMLAPGDQISIFAKPDYKEHRTVTLTGQVVRPGTYELDGPRTSLLEVIKRAGGLTPEAMPSAAIFLRALGGADADKQRANQMAGVENTDPTSNGVNEILKRLSETLRLPTGSLEMNPLLHGLSAGSLNRLVMNLPAVLAGDTSAEVELQDHDEIIIPRKTEVAYVVGETASPFAAYKVSHGTRVKDLIDMAGGPTRNADTWHIRLLKADGRILDKWVGSKNVEPGDAVLVPQRIRRDVSWQENLAALTPAAILINALRN